MKISLSENQKKRCRYMLKPYMSQNVIVYGCLSGGVLDDQKLKKEPEKEQLALFTDVKIIKNADTKDAINLDIDHVHVRIKNKHLTRLLNMYFSFTASIYQYETAYKNNSEKRYGLTNFQIQPLKKGVINDLVLAYRNRITAYEKVLIQHLRLLIAKKYSIKQMNNNQTIDQKLLSYTDFRNRTNLLEKNLTALEKGQFMDQTLLSWFSNPKIKYTDNINDYKSRYLNLKSQFDQLKIRYKKQHHQFEHQIKLYEATITQQRKSQPKSLWSAIKQYFQMKKSLNQIKLHHQAQTNNPISTNTPKIDNQKLAELQTHFNSKS